MSEAKHKKNKKITAEVIIDLIIDDIDLIVGNCEKQTFLFQLAALDALNKSIVELDTVSKYTRNQDDFYTANKLYIAVISAYAELLKNEMQSNNQLKTEQKDVEFINEQSTVFIALIAKLFRNARTLTTTKELQELLPGKLWFDNVKPLYVKETTTKENNTNV